MSLCSSLPQETPGYDGQTPYETHVFLIQGTFNIYKVSLREVVDLESRGCRKLKRGNTGVPMYI